MIIEYITQNPGQMEQNSSNYKGYKKRTVIFLNDWVDAQFMEVQANIIQKWKEGEKHTSNVGENYSSMNCSLVPRKFIVIYHDNDWIIS